MVVRGVRAKMEKLGKCLARLALIFAKPTKRENAGKATTVNVAATLGCISPKHVHEQPNMSHSLSLYNMD